MHLTLSEDILLQLDFSKKIFEAHFSGVLI